MSGDAAFVRPRSRRRHALRKAAAILVAAATLAVLTTGTSIAYLRSHRAAPPSGATGVLQQAIQDGRGSDRTLLAGPLASRSATAPVQPVVPVAKLDRLYLPDAVVTPARPVTARELAAVQKLPGIQGVVAVLHGTTTLTTAHGPQRVGVLAVDPSTFRGFTPRPTAASDPLWQVPGQGELIASYELNKKAGLTLGGYVPLGRAPHVRVGALAEFSLPGVDVVVGRTRAAAAGATQQLLLVSAPGSAAATIQQTFARVLGGAVRVDMLRPAFVAPLNGGGSGVRADSPAGLRTLYIRAAATCPGLPWGVLAGIGQVETDHGRVKAVSSAGAMGPMQFLPSTWAVYGVDGDGDGKADILDQADAIYSAARYLCASGGGQADTLYDAIYAYNHSDYYVRTVLGLAVQYH